MTKLELNDKLAGLYNLPSKKEELTYWKERDEYTLTDYEYADILLIDDSARMFDLAVKNKIDLVHYGDGVEARYEIKNDCFYYREGAIYIDHESPQAAARYAIAMALIKLAEGK